MTIFKVSRVPVQLHWSWLIYPAGVWLHMAHESLRRNAMTIAVVFLALLVFSMLVHEFGHVFAARRCGIDTKRVVIIPVGMVAQLKTLPKPSHEFWIAIAGPMASFGLAGFFWLGSLCWTLVTPVGRELPAICAAMNLILGAANLLPCFPMDGGRILRSLTSWVICRWFGREAEHARLMATRIAVRYVGWPIFLAVLGLAFWIPVLWFHVVVLVLVVAFGELEYWVLRDEAAEGGSGSTS
jgi:Zn-dependent protease